MKSLVPLLETLLIDLGRKCNAPIRRDIKTMSRRAECEGDSYFTITLPRYGQAFERALDQKRLSPEFFHGISKSHGKLCYPSFLKGFMSQVFDSTGDVLEEPNPDCILAIRQFCLFAKKISRPCKETRLRDAELAFLKCESEVNNAPKGVLWSTYKKVCRIVMSDIASSTMYEELIPRHGPGTTAERILSNKKYVHQSWHSRLETVFPFTEFGLGSLNNLSDTDFTMPNFSEPWDEQPVRVVFVPKTLKTPRVIAIEPVCMQYAQQALLQWLVPSIERGRYTSGRVNFTDQSVNQALAHSSSISGKYATLDLSEASDRVSIAAASALYSLDPVLHDLVFASRSTRASLPSGRVISLDKFASMGSAMCFPTEALVFFCTIVAARLVIANVRVDPRSVYSFSRDVYVYGDDIIVPADQAFVICAHLSDFGLKVNSHKSFWTGKFRESCGAEYYDGKKVTPVYLRRDIPTNRADFHGILSNVSTANQLFEAGLYRTSFAIKDAIEQLIGKLPTVSKTSAAIGWTFYSDYVPPTRWCDKHHRTLARCYVPFSRSKDDLLTDDPALVKCLLRLGKPDLGMHFRKEFLQLLGRNTEMSESLLNVLLNLSTNNAGEKEHLLRSVGRGCLTLKRRWVPL